MPRVPFAVHSNLSGSKPLSVQRLTNWYPRIEADDAKAKLTLRGTPGLKDFGTAGNGPVRGQHKMAGVLYVVSGSTLYSAASGGTTTNLGAIPGSGTVFMADNGTELTILSGTLGYIYNGATLAQITDTDFPAADTVDFMDGYAIFSRPDSGQFFISALYDSGNIDALDFATAESAPDDTVRVFVDHRELWIFGEYSTEIWYNAGSTFPFARTSVGVIERGCLARGSVAKDDNSVFWLGDDKIIYRAAGYTPKRISTHNEETLIAGYASPENATAFTYTQDGHKFYVLTFDEGTLVYDMTTQLWHERQSYGLGRWRVSGGVSVYGKVIVGDYSNGKLYELDPDTYDESGEPLIAKAVSPPYHGSGRRIGMPRVELEFEMGVGLTTGQGSDPQAMLRYSDDGGRTWSNEQWRSIGKIGEYRNRARWNRLGSFYSRSLEISISDPVKRTLIAADVMAG